MNFSIRKLVYASLGLGLAIGIANPKTVLAGTITINQNGTISVPIATSVLGKSTTGVTNSAKDKAEKTTTTIKQLRPETKEIKITGSTNNSKLVIQAVDEDGEITELAEDEEVVLPAQEQNQTQVATKIMTKAQNRYLVTNGVAAKVGTPISYNLETNEMIISTPHGDKIVSVLPDQALAKARAAASLIVEDAADDESIDEEKTATESAKDSTATPSGEEETATDSADEDESIEEAAISLVSYQDSPAYKVSGKSQKKVLGVIPVKINKTVYVSAVSGNIIEETTDSPLDTLLNLISR